MKTKTVGMNIDGWADVAARDWSADDPDQAVGQPIVLDGGAGTVAIRQDNDEWIGGPQAFIAPHGRGLGWGRLGGPDRRVSIADCHAQIVAGLGANTHAYAAAIKALARNAQSIVLTVADTPDLDEAVQGRFLSVLKSGRQGGGRPPRMRLLWRPVALFLACYERGLINLDEVGERFGFIVHTAKGFEIQTLRLRADQEHSGHYAPEREGFGSAFLSGWGLTRLKNLAKQAIIDSNPALLDGVCEDEQISLQLLLGRIEPGSPHVVRRNNGNWLEIRAPHLSPEDIVRPDHAAEFVTNLQSYPHVTKWFFTTPLAHSFSKKMLDLLGDQIAILEELPWESLAVGALKAGRLIERGRPHYYDRLTPISLAIMRREEPAFEDLIGESATVPANKEYTSPPYSELRWARTKDEIDFYVLKGVDEIRHWRASLPAAPDRDIAIELRLKQTPGQSWAKLTLSSPDWEMLQRSPIFLDWEKLAPISMSPEEVLESLKAPPPVVPKRIVERPTIDLWHGTALIAGLAPELVRMDQARSFDARLLARFLSRSTRDDERMRRWTIGTDGDFPEGLSERATLCFADAISALASQITAAVAKKRALPSNDVIRALTWTFTRCPEAIQGLVLDALEADGRSQPHPLMGPTSARRVLTQGAGRVVSDIEQIRRLMDILLSRKSNSDTLNALAMLLSRRQEAPQALSPVLVTKMAQIVRSELEALALSVSFKTRFRYCLSVLAGLFRYREVEPYALLASNDTEAYGIKVTLERVDALLRQHQSKVSQFQEKLSLVESIKDMLDGGGDPDILRRIEATDEDDQL